MTDRARELWGLVLLAALLAGTTAVARRPPETPELDRERDLLIDKLVRGEDFEQSMARFKALVARRDAIRPTSMAAKAAEEERLLIRRTWEEAWRKTADAEVAWRCALSADPKNPRETDRWRGDWGRVVKKEVIRLAPKNALDEGESWTVYEVQGQRRTYRFRGEGFGLFRHGRFEAEKGDLVLVCDGGTDTMPHLPEPWREGFQRSGFAVRLRSVPLIAKKAKWDPIHITDNTLYWAVKDVRWKLPQDVPVLSVIDILEDAGEGRYRIDTLQDVTFLVEVPPDLPNRSLMVPGTRVWAIMSRPRFDPKLKALVLTVEDLEARYIDELVPDDDEPLARER